MAISICNVHKNQSQKEITAHGSVAYPIACYEDDMQLISVPVHWHDEYEFITATEGKVTVYVNGEQIDLNTGDSLFINSGCLHGVKTVTEEESVLRSLVILPKLIGGSTDSIFFKRLVLPFLADTAPSYFVMNAQSDWQLAHRALMLRAWTAITEEAYDFENESRYLICSAMRLLVDHLSEFDLSYRPNNILLERVKRSMTYMEEHYSEEISNQDLTKLLNCSESVLLRSFRQAANTSPMQYLLNFRIQKAVELLLTTNATSRNIAEACGFHDFSYFTKVFKRSMGLTPGQYRGA